MLRLPSNVNTAFVTAVFTWLLFCAGTAWADYYGRSVPIANVKVLTLQSGKMTAGRRSDPVPQLVCTGGCEVELDAVQCRNVGSDGRDIQWKCEADLPRHLRFAKTEVTCEGYSYPDDPDILEGSCGLEYSLKRDKSAGSGYGYESSHSHRSQDGWGHEHSHRHHERYRMPTSTGTNLGQWLMYGVLAFIAYGLYKQCTGARNQPRTFGRGFAAGDTRPSAPPPPGYPHDDYGPGGPPGGGGYGGYGGGSYWSQQAAPAAGGGLGGWGGLVGGLGLGYLLGRPRGTMHGYGYGQPAYGGRTGGWGWGGWGRSATATTTTTSPRHNSSASSSFGGTHTSTAYAGTRRR